MPDASNELWTLLNSLCEGCITPAQTQRLEALVLSSPEARWHYVAYLNLHGTLYWDAAGGMALSRAEPVDVVADVTNLQPLAVLREGPPARSQRMVLGVGFSSLAALFLCSFFWLRPGLAPDAVGPAVVQQSSEQQSTEQPSQSAMAAQRSVPTGSRQPVQLQTREEPVPRTGEAMTVDQTTPGVPEHPAGTLPDRSLPVDVRRPVAFINQEIRAAWEAAGVSPSARSDDAAWLRRVSLDLLGHIPSGDEVRRFLADRRRDKRERLIDQLLDDPGFARQLTTQWTNLLVGRSPAAMVDRPALQKFLRTSFAENRGWDVIVTDLVSAEGRSDENGAANFLVAHLNNQAVPATAITARLFLGVQVNCVQCHNHPSGVARQTDFWEFNSFFLQTQSHTLVQRDPKTGAATAQVAELVSEPIGGPTYYETPAGAVKAVYPRYHGTEISPEPGVNRRSELARLMVEVDGPQLAQAFVNRTWQHFFGYGFTRQVDDLGPHNPPSHPQLLAGLGESFRQSGFDIKQLTRWICLSEPYQLSSSMHDGNRSDDPDRGETPLFSRVYPQPMSVEQLYDSFLVATKAHQHGTTDWAVAEKQRQAWLQQFIVTFQTEENDEANTFDGTVTQALTLMNGPLVEKALEPSPGTYLGEVVRSSGPETEKIEKLCLAALSRKPNSRELAAMHKLVRKSPSGVEGYQDLFWALLNSNEFAVTY